MSPCLAVRGSAVWVMVFMLPWQPQLADPRGAPGQRRDSKAASGCTEEGVGINTLYSGDCVQYSSQ